MVVNQGRKRAKRNRKNKRKVERENARIFGIITTDSKGNQRISLK